LNTVFGVLCALAVVRHEWRGKRCWTLPQPAAGRLAGGRRAGPDDRLQPARRLVRPWLAERGIQVIFALPSMVLATIFVSLPFVAREVIPVLREIGTDQEQAAQVLGASAWQTFWQITLPAIRAGVAYGVVLTTARALGEYGAVAIVSGSWPGARDADPPRRGAVPRLRPDRAYAASLVLAGLALATLLLLHVLKPRRESDAMGITVRHVRKRFTTTSPSTTSRSTSRRLLTALLGPSGLRQVDPARIIAAWSSRTAARS
jgi:sulfate transport system permease protein